MVSIEVKRISSSCKTRMRVPISVYENYANHCLRIYTQRTQHFACMYDTETCCICVYRKNLSLRQYAASVGLIHASMNVSAGLSDANSTLSFLTRVFPCCIRRRSNISSRSCHCTMWAALQSQGRQQSMSPGGGKL